MNNELNDGTSLLAGNEAPEESVETVDDTISLKKTFQRPDNVPEQFWDPDNGSYKGDDLFKAYKAEQDRAEGLRKKLSKGFQNVPDMPEKYQIDLGEDFEINTDDDGIQMFREISHKYGLSHEQFNGVLKEFSERMGDFSDDSDSGNFDEYKEQYFQEQIESLGDKGPALIKNVATYGRTLLTQGVFSEEEYNAFVAMPRSAAELKALNKMRMAAGYINDVPIDIGAPTDQLSEAEVQKMIADPNYDRDPVLQRKVTDYYTRKYPG